MATKLFARARRLIGQTALAVPITVVFSTAIPTVARADLYSERLQPILQSFGQWGYAIALGLTMIGVFISVMIWVVTQRPPMKMFAAVLGGGLLLFVGAAGLDWLDAVTGDNTYTTFFTYTE